VYTKIIQILCLIELLKIYGVCIFETWFIFYTCLYWRSTHA